MIEAKPEWIKMKSVDVEKLITDLHKEKHHPAKIGVILRDKHGIPKAKLFGKKISDILKSAKLEPVSEDEIISSKIKNLESHISKNKHDYTSKRSLTKKLWIVRKLKKE